MEMPQRLDGKVALVTGASRGIGLGIAQRLVAEGAKVAITARKPEGLAQAAATFPPGSVLTFAGKSDDGAHRVEVLDGIANQLGGLDILINNAGINPVFGPLAEVDLTAARKILEVNVIGTLSWVQEVLAHPELKFRARGGNIVNISSVAGRVPSAGLGIYGVSKAANSHLAATLAVELGPEIRVNAVAPAVVKTDFAKPLYQGREAQVAAEYPLKRLGTPEDIAAAVAFLVSADASWLTGQLLTLDGGLLTAGGKV